MPFNCAVCKEELKKGADSIKCISGCKQRYHIDCVNISEGDLKKMTSSKKDDWLCTECTVLVNCAECKEELKVGTNVIKCEAGCKQIYHIKCVKIAEGEFKKMTISKKEDWLCKNCANCARCEEQLPIGGEAVTCLAGCQRKYHITCTTLSELTYRRMTKTKRDEWYCVSCRDVKKMEQERKKNSVDLERKEEEKDLGINPTEEESNEDEPKEKSVIEIGTEGKHLLVELNSNVLLLTQKVDALEKSVQFMSNKYDTLLKEVVTLREWKDTQMGVKEKVKNLEDRVNEMEQYSRTKNIEIKGVEECVNENLKQVVVKIAHKVGEVGITENDIDSVHRIGNMNNRNPKDIIVQFKDRVSRNRLLLKRKERIRSNEVAEGRKDNVVYINEHLTAYNKQLFWQAKVKSKELNFKFVWSKEGKIFIRKSEREKAYRIRNEEDLTKIK